MRSIGVRELRQNASKYLREVEQGESIRVTDRGRPVALLVPVPRSRLEELIATGRATPGRGSVLDLGPPLPAEPGEKPLSEILEEDRNDER